MKLVLCILGVIFMGYMGSVPASADVWTGRVTQVKPASGSVAFDVEVKRDGVVDRIVTLRATTSSKADVKKHLNDYLMGIAYEEANPVVIDTQTSNTLIGISTSVDSEGLRPEDLPSFIPEDEETVEIPISEFGSGLAGVLAGAGILTIRGRRRKEPS